MIVIWDSGAEATGHKTTFIKLQPEEKLEDVLEVLSLLNLRDYGSYIIAVVESIDWRRPEDMSDMTEWIRGFAVSMTRAGDMIYEKEYAPAFRKLPMFWRKRIAEALLVSIEHWWNVERIADAKKIMADLLSEGAK